MNKVKFNFWCPVDISKAIDPSTGKEIMRLGGIASTSDKDSDGEFLDPKGFDIKPLVEKGIVNWHHQAKDKPATIIGEPSKAEIRKEGLYIETDLYPSSEVARDVYTLAETLEKDSKTRRLGYSIEGKVVERDKKNPKIIKKAIITGVAITHQPKNPKTFADIIKGEIDDDDEVEESMDTENGKALKKESVNKKVKVTTFSKAEVMEKLFEDIPGLEIEKADNIYQLIETYSMATKKTKRVSDEDIQKAYDALGIEAPTAEDITKGDEVVTNEDEDGDDDVDEKEFKRKEKAKKGNLKKAEDAKGDHDYHEADGGDTDDEPGDDEDDDEDDKKKAKKAKKDTMKKGETSDIDRIEKAMENGFGVMTAYVKALGVLVKGQTQELIDLRKENEELKEVVKGYDDEFANLHNGIEKIGGTVPARKSVSSAKAVERFAKAEDSDIEKGGANVMSLSSDKARILDTLDSWTFEKGYDSELSKAVQTFEASGQLPANIIARMKAEKNITLTK